FDGDLERQALELLLASSDFRIHHGGDDAAAHLRARAERAIEPHSEPFPELLAVTESAPYSFAGSPEEDLLLDAIGLGSHAQPPGCTSIPRGEEMQPKGCASDDGARAVPNPSRLRRLQSCQFPGGGGPPPPWQMERPPNAGLHVFGC